jgi:hypothetical protein
MGVGMPWGSRFFGSVLESATLVRGLKAWTLCGRYGEGRVICFSPHDEGGEKEAIFVRAVCWLARTMW